MSKRGETPNRYRAARNDASVRTIERRIEKEYGLPPGSVRINKPRSDRFADIGGTPVKVASAKTSSKKAAGIRTAVRDFYGDKKRK